MQKVLLSLVLIFSLVFAPLAHATVAEQDSEDRYTANGATTAFVYTFKILDDDDIAVYVNDTLQTKTTHYSVSGVAASGGGTVTFVTAPADTSKVTLIRRQPVSQLTNYIANSSYSPLTVMQDLDKNAMIDQMQSELLRRVPRFAVKSTYNGITIDDPVASQFLRWKSDLSGIESATLASLSNVDAALTSPGVAFASGTQLTTDATNFVWNNTDKRLGLGTASPSYRLDIGSGSINIPRSASDGLRFGGTGLLVRVDPATPGVINSQSSGNGVTTSLQLTPTSGTLPTGTLTEFTLHRTLAQDFGGNYGRWALTALGSDYNNTSGLYGEFGGSVTPTEFLFVYGVEDPAETFTSYEPMRFQAGADIGTVGFCIFATSPTPKDCIQLISQDLGSAGQRDSHAVMWRGKANDGSEHSATWRAFADVTSNAGASSFVFQNKIDAASYATHAEILGVASAVNYLRLAPSTTTNPTIISAQGSDSDIQINLVPKGTGGVLLGGPLISVNGQTPVNATKTVRDAAGTGTCTLIFTTGVLTGGTC